MNKSDQNQSNSVVGQKYGLAVYDRNPSVPLAGDISKHRRSQIGNDKRGVVVDQDSGEILGHGGAMIYEFEEVDKERFVKLYLAGLKQAAGLSKAGLAVFQLVYDQVRANPGKDEIKLSPTTSGIPPVTYRRGLRELLEKEFLFRTPYDGLFWVNIRFMFNGNRLAFVKGYQIKGTSQQLDLLAPLGDTDNQ